MKLEGVAFSDAFTFARAVPAPARDASGALVTVPAGQPRFDHEPDGRALGLLVEPGETLGQADRCAVIAGDWEIVGPATVLHELAELDGSVIRRAWYTRSCRATVNGVLGARGHHRIIAAVPGYLSNRGGFVRYRERRWAVAGFIGTGVAGEVLEDGTAADRLLTER